MPKKKTDGLTLFYFAMTGMAKLCSSLADQAEPAATARARALEKNQSLLKQKMDAQRAILDLFIGKYCVIDPAASAQAGPLYDAYVTTCWPHKPEMSKKYFGMLMGERFRKVKKGLIFYEGVRLRPEDARSDWEDRVCLDEIRRVRPEQTVRNTGQSKKRINGCNN